VGAPAGRKEEPLSDFPAEQIADMLTNTWVGPAVST